MIALIRHGKTQGNLEGRYVGRTDEGLCEAGRAELRARQYPPVAHVFISPMRRCAETAAILYPGVAPVVVPDFREIDFGEFEYRTYAELSGNPAYQAWIDSMGELPFPKGESKAVFTARCVRAFAALVPRLPDADCALIVHGGTIMSILETYAAAPKSYYDYQVKNAEGYRAEWLDPARRELRVQPLFVP